MVGNEHGIIHGMVETNGSIDADCFDVAKIIREEILLKLENSTLPPFYLSRWMEKISSLQSK